MVRKCDLAVYNKRPPVIIFLDDFPSDFFSAFQLTNMKKKKKVFMGRENGESAPSSCILMPFNCLAVIDKGENGYPS